jgi:hypothetical protein
MRTLLAMIGTWFMFNAFLAVAATNDKLQSWVSYLCRKTRSLTHNWESPIQLRRKAL